MIQDLNLKTKILAEFDEMFDLDNYGESHILQNKVKSFLSSAIDQTKEETLKEVEKIIYNHFPETYHPKRDQVLLEVREALEKLREYK